MAEPQPSAEESAAPAPITNLALAVHGPVASVGARGAYDILNPNGFARNDLRALERALDFAFASGGAETVGDALAEAAIEPSSWDAKSFASDLFVEELIATCFTKKPERGARVREDKRPAKLLQALFVKPPRDVSVARARADVLRALDRDEGLRNRLLALHEALVEVLALLRPSEVYEEIRPRQLAILRGVHRAVLALGDGFESETMLGRLADLGRSIRESKAFDRLSSLLEIEGHLAGVDVKMRIGLDGKVRAFELARVDENTANALYQTPWRRFMRKVRLWFRGYGFKDDEVLEGVMDGAFEGMKPALAKMVALAPQVAFYAANLAFAERAREAGLEVCLPTLAPHDDASAPRRFEKLFNPHLFDIVGPGRAPVPCDLDFGARSGISIFTGPNSGGKTRMLQAVAIAQMLAQTGGFVPARAAHIVATEGLFVSIHQEQRADQKEGRLGMELVRIRDVFEQLRPGGMVMLDELCSGTNPSEGEEIFELVTGLLAELQPQALITTHFLDFAHRLAARPPSMSKGKLGLSFYQVELDEDDEPTYGFVQGVAKSSLAARTAARLGVTREALEKLIARKQRERR